ncbi:MAG: serine protein kinase PrkA [Sandaracinus sp.]
MTTRAQADLARIGASVRERFSSERRVLSFDEYLALFEESPYRFTRDAARYLADCFGHFGTAEVQRAGRKVQRFRLFDLPWDERRKNERLVGQEEIQAEFHRALSNFVREGRINRLVMLHGPNGSAKSTFVSCLMKALEHYATTDEGAIYVFSWIFPRGRDGRAVGFGSIDDVPSGPSYAHLPDGNIELRIGSELRESPLLLLPTEDRKRILADAFERAGRTDGAPVSLVDGALGAKNRQIFEALLTAYRGDLSRVLAHVRVERFYVSQRYRQGAVTVGPQMAVDATERQITVDRSLASLPASLQSLSLFETHGDLADASSGILEFSDLLKRPLDAWRYLLLAIEEGEISLGQSVMPLNTVLVATSNDVHLKAFREHHEYRSFRGRLSLVKVPYLLETSEEQSIYEAQIVPQVRGLVAPHATYVAALWAVLTRLRRPVLESYANKKLGHLAVQLSPLEKADYYDALTIPNRFSNDEIAELRAGFEQIRHESDGWALYEGSTGASPREIRTLLLDAAQDAEHGGLTPLSVLEKIRELCESDDFDFLKEPPENGYHDHRGFIELVRGRWLDRVDEEVRVATGLVDEAQYVELFDRYVTHVSYSLKKERIYNPVTGKDEEPDQKLMENVEQMLGVTKGQETFRRDIMSGVAAHAIDHPGEKPSFPRVFPRLLAQVREATFQKRKKQIAEIIEDTLSLLAQNTKAIPAERLRRAEDTKKRMMERHGYQERSLGDSLSELLRRRYH